MPYMIAVYAWGFGYKSLSTAIGCLGVAFLLSIKLELAWKCSYYFQKIKI